jgi:hypothetical protein
MNTGRPFNSHTLDAVTGPDPWKIYHNTIQAAPDMDNEGVGAAYNLALYDPLDPQEVYNNIFIQTGDQWILRGARIGDGSQILDGNLYFRSLPDLRTPLFYPFPGDNGTASYDTLAAWNASNGPVITHEVLSSGVGGLRLRGQPRAGQKLPAPCR